MAMDVKTVNFQKDKAAFDSATLDNIREKIGTDFTDKKMSGRKSKNEMGKDDFIKLMSAQLKHQDPINPMKNEQMAAQLAQFSALEQMVNVNQNLEKMAASAKPQESALAASLIGKRVLTDSATVTYDKKSEAEIKFDLPKSASSVSVAVINNKGEVIREINLNSLKEGKQAVRWNGKGDNGLEVQAGDYGYRVTALDEKKSPMDVKMSSSGLVTGVEFEGGKPMLLVDNKRIAMSAINKIEDGATTKAPIAPAASAMAAAIAGMEATPEAAKTLSKNTMDNLTSKSDKNVKSSSTNPENNYVKNSQKNLQSSSAAETINKDTAASQNAESGIDSSAENAPEERVATSGIPGMDLWNPNNM